MGEKDRLKASIVSANPRDLLLKAILFKPNTLLDPQDLLYAGLLNYVEVEESKICEIAAARFSKDLKFRIYVNIENIIKSFPNMNSDQLVYLLRAIVKHELWHIISGHIFMLGKSVIVNGKRINQKSDVLLKIEGPIMTYLYNLATDSIINEQIVEFKNLDVLLISPEEFLEEHFDENDKRPIFVGKTKLLTGDYTAEELTAVLYLRYKEAIQRAFETFKTNNANRVNYEYEKHILNGDFIQDKDTNGETFLSETLERIADTVISKAQEEAKKLKGYERLNAYLKLKPSTSKLDWNHLLANVISSVISQDKLIVNKHRLNKRYNTAPKITRARAPKIVAFIDSSGSVSDELLQRFVDEVSGLTSKLNVSVILYFFSVDISPRQLVRRKNQELVVTERGGTNLKTALQQAKKNDLKTADVLIIFTDGYDDFPEKELKSLNATKVFIFPREHDTEYEKEAKKLGNVILIDN